MLRVDLATWSRITKTGSIAVSWFPYIIGGRWYVITQLTVYTTYIPLIVLANWVITYYLPPIKEPGNSIDWLVVCSTGLKKYDARQIGFIFHKVWGGKKLKAKCRKGPSRKNPGMSNIAMEKSMEKPYDFWLERHIKIVLISIWPFYSPTSQSHHKPGKSSRNPN